MGGLLMFLGIVALWGIAVSPISAMVVSVTLLIMGGNLINNKGGY